MVWILFFLAVVVTVYTAVKLSYYADIIGEETKMGGLWAGTIILAGATSLPEVATSISAALINAPNIAVGNVFGSNIFNIFNLAIIEPFCMAGPLLASVSTVHILPAALGMILSAVAALGILLKIKIAILNIGIISILLALIYAIGIRSLNIVNSRRAPEPEVLTLGKPRGRITIRQATIGFAISCVVIIASGVTLTYTGDQIAKITGLGGTFIGSILIAMSTSLPETSAGIAAARAGSYDMAVGNYMGSNTFNMLIILVSDIFFRQGPILAHVEMLHVVTCLFGLIMSGIVIISLVQRPRRRFAGLSGASIIIVITYLTATYILFTGSKFGLA